MEIRVLRYFLTVAREGSISSAAEYLHVTQPTLSKQLMGLEQELGKKLFVRGNRRISLTEDGMFLRKRAQDIVDLADKTEADFHSQDDDLSGELNIGGGETGAMQFIAKTAKKLHDIYPNIRFHINSGNSIDITEQIDKGLLDFGVIVGLSDPHRFNYIKLPITYGWGLLIPNDSEIAACERVTPDILSGAPLLCTRQMMIQNQLEGWFGSNYHNINVVATYNLIYNASLMVEEGMGYALCLDYALRFTSSNKLCFRKLDPPIRANLYLTWRKYQVFSKAAEKFLGMLRQTVEEDEKRWERMTEGSKR